MYKDFFLSISFGKTKTVNINAIKFDVIENNVGFNVNTRNKNEGIQRMQRIIRFFTFKLNLNFLESNWKIININKNNDIYCKIAENWKAFIDNESVVNASPAPADWLWSHSDSILKTPLSRER